MLRLICQIFNIYVLQASSVATRVVLAEERPSTLSLQVFQTDDQGRERKVIDQPIQTDAYRHSFSKNQPDSPQDSLIKLNYTSTGVRLSSGVMNNAFSLFLCANGNVILQDLENLNLSKP